MAVRSQIGAVAVAVLVVTAMGAVVSARTGAGDATDAPDVADAQETTTAQNETAVMLRNLSAPAEVEVGSAFTVRADLVNRGDAEDVRRVRYRIAGNVIQSTVVQLSPGDAETVTFNVTDANTSGFPTGTFTQGVFTDGANVTTNLTLTAPGETATPGDEATNETTAESANETTEAPPDQTTTQATADETASLDFEDQTSNGSAVTVRSVAVPEGGFVVIHDNGVVEGDVVDSILGTSEYLDAGTTENLTVPLDRPLNQSQEVVAVVYRDTNDNRTFDFVTSNRTADGPYTKVDSNEAVNGIAVVDVTDGATNETA
ncbi:DUF7282 domain-containing protein [Halorussus marinus]|uniref:DUF7282 domain-containing protein n=1 Tax=Halorussus marinus TaxID=2505976 RepID=UPI00106E508D|nr:hypothetical protein [Halorussus marinus]